MSRLKIPNQMLERSLWAVWFLCFGGAGIWILVGSVSYWVKHGWLPADASGWVQAFGSIGAIVGTFFVADRAHRLERKAAEDHSRALEAEALRFAENASYETFRSLESVLGTAKVQPYKISLSNILEKQRTYRLVLNRPLPTQAYFHVYAIQTFLAEAVEITVRMKSHKDLYAEYRDDLDSLEQTVDAVKHSLNRIAEMNRWATNNAGGHPYVRPQEF